MAEGTPRSLRKILVVEDSRTQAEYLRHILENEGYRVTLAENGSEALEQVAIDQPAVIFTDVVMPEIDGYEFCRRVKTDPKTASIPVVLVTQLFDPADVIRGLECGADDFIIKPFEAGYLKSRIGTILASVQETDEDPAPRPLPVHVGGTTYQVSAGRRRIFNILLSTYEVAVSKNAELLETQDRLAATNDQLKDAIFNLEQTNEQLAQENTERRRIQKALDEANTKLNLMASITRHDVINQLTSQHESLDSALSLRDRDPKKAWEHVATAAEIATQTLSSVRFTSEYQKVGVKAPQWFNLAALVNAAIQRSLPGPVKIENALPEDREIYADPLIGMVFANLIDNALRYGCD
jgi:CheY-like chemotaxis protein